MNMSAERAAAICGGRLCGKNFSDASLGRVVIDSRAVMPGDLFVAFSGKNVDGHDYISAAFDKGAVCCLANRVPAGETRPVIVVEDVQRALEQICAAYRRELSIPIIGITGSVGKTSAKEMISAVLSQRLSIHKTDKNLNNQIGVPMTLSGIEPSHDAAVVEMGITTFGDMSELAAMVRPTIGVFTVIGHAHLEFLHDLDGVLRAKTEMLDYMADDALVIVNGDDERLASLSCRQKKLTFGLREGCDIRAENVIAAPNGATRLDVVYGARRIAAEIPAYGQHMVYAALEGAAVGLVLGLDDGEIARGIASYETVGRRAAVVDTGTITLIDDCYNANPDSVCCGVDSLCTLPGRRVCILGDMLELGENSPEMHEQVGRYAAEKGIDLVLCCGELAKHIKAGAGENGCWYESRTELIADLKNQIKSGDKVLVKASHSMKFEEISEALKSL